MECHTIPFNVEEGKKEGPQLLRSNGAQEQVEVDKSEKSGKQGLKSVPVKNPIVMYLLIILDF